MPSPAREGALAARSQTIFGLRRARPPGGLCRSAVAVPKGARPPAAPVTIVPSPPLPRVRRRREHIQPGGHVFVPRNLVPVLRPAPLRSVGGPPRTACAFSYDRPWVPTSRVVLFVRRTKRR